MKQPVSPEQEQCKECNALHVEKAPCSQCGACLYKNAKQIPNQTYPLFKCTKCGKVNFWD